MALLHASFYTLLAQAPVSLVRIWESDTVLRIPESVVYNPQNDLLLVTNMNAIHDDAPDGDGFISLLKLSGEIENLHWITGLNDPKGMAIYGGRLYVGDLSELVEIDLASAAVVKKYAPAGARFFNDVTVDKDGTVYVSDSFDNKIYRLKNGKIEVWLEGAALDMPNGLLAEKDRILLANMNQGKIYTVDPKSKKATLWTKEIPRVDGIATDARGTYLASSWEGEVYYLNAKGENWKVLDTRSSKINAADLTYIEKGDFWVVPTFFGNKVVAYRIQKK